MGHRLDPLFDSCAAGKVEQQLEGVSGHLLASKVNYYSIVLERKPPRPLFVLQEVSKMGESECCVGRELGPFGRFADQRTGTGLSTRTGLLIATAFVVK